MKGVTGGPCSALASRALAFLVLGTSISCASSSFVLAQGKFQDSLDAPAKQVTNLSRRPLLAITKAGATLVAVGSRGLVITSADQGRTWSQSKVPVQSDLLAVHFPTPSEGWVVGHDGVVLHSDDGGRTWQLQLDGRVSGPSFKAFYESRGAEGAPVVEQLKLNYRAGAALPFLDVWFENAKIGYAVGSFGMIIATTDGGKHWEPWLHKIDNPEYLNLNAIRGVGEDVYVVGERGQIYRLDRVSARFTRTDTGYLGSIFGIVDSGQTLVAFGLRGTAYRSTTREGRWEPVSMPNEHTITAGVTRNGGFVLVNAAGELLVTDSAAAGEMQFRVCPASKPMRMTGVVALDDKNFVVTGLDGVRNEAGCNAARSAQQ